MEAIVTISQVKSSELGAVTQRGSLADACHHRLLHCLFTECVMEALNEEVKRSSSAPEISW